MPTNLWNDIPFPRCLKKILLCHHGLANHKWRYAEGFKTLSDWELKEAFYEHVPNCVLLYKNLGQSINCVPRDDSEYEGDEWEEGEGEEEEDLQES